MKDVSILVNNVGIYRKGTVATTPIPDLLTQLTVNTVPQTFMTRILLPQLLARSKSGKRCVVIDISSSSRYTRKAGKPMYAATKSFDHTLSHVLNKEYGEWVDFMAVTLGPTETKLLGKVTIITIKPEQNVRNVLARLGHESETFGHWKHILYYHVMHTRMRAYFYQKVIG
jgi:short-subunit dehydrogenase